MLRLAFDFIITWRETRTRPNAYLSSITWTKIMCRCIHRSADVTTKAVVGITTLRKSIFKSILNTELPMISLLTGKEQSRRK